MAFRPEHTKGAFFCAHQKSPEGFGLPGIRLWFFFPAVLQAVGVHFFRAGLTHAQLGAVKFGNVPFAPVGAGQLAQVLLRLQQIGMELAAEQGFLVEQIGKGRGIIQLAFVG